MKSFWPIVGGAIAALAWFIYVLNSSWYSAGVEYYGEESMGLCLGGPALMILMMVFLGFEIHMDTRRRKDGN